MAFTTGQTRAQMVAELVSIGALTDQANTIVASAGLLPAGSLTVVSIYGSSILIKTTTSAATTLGQDCVFSYDATPS